MPNVVQRRVALLGEDGKFADSMTPQLVLEIRDQVQQVEITAAGSATSAADSASAAASARADAVTARNGAQAAQIAAAGSASQAGAAAAAAQVAQTGAETARGQAEVARQGAETALAGVPAAVEGVLGPQVGAAQSAASAAQTSEASAATSATQAGSAAQTATTMAGQTVALQDAAVAAIARDTSSQTRGVIDDVSTAAGSQAAVQTLADNPEVVTAAAELAQSDVGLTRKASGDSEWLWALAFGDTNEVAIGCRTDGTYYPPSLGVARPGCLIVGDSLSSNWGQSITDLVAKTGLSWSSIGIGGQTPPQIFARYGSEPLMVTVAGQVIPASGPVAVTLPDRLRSDITNATQVSLAGVQGTFITTDSTTFLSGVFTRTTPGAPWPAPAPTPMVTGIGFRDQWPIIWVGRNGFKMASPGTYVALIQRALDWMTDDARQHALIFSIPPWVGEELGTSMRATLDSFNAAYQEAFPSRFVDIAARLRTEQALALAGITPTSQDAADISVGITPTSLRNAGDGGHINVAAYGVVNSFVAAEYASRGWI